MNTNQQSLGIVQLLDQIQNAINKAQGNSVSLEMVLEIVGRKSFGSLLFITGIITLAPIIGDIPGIPTLMGIVVFLVAIQLLLNRENLWLPQFLLKRSLKKEKLTTALNKSKKPARFIDRYLKPRFTLLTDGIMIYIIAGICICIAVTMPVMELIPFSANIAGILLTAFGLSIITRDGLPIIIAFVFALLIGALIVLQVL